MNNFNRVLIIIGIIAFAVFVFFKLRSNKEEMKKNATTGETKISVFPVEVTEAAYQTLSSDFGAAGTFAPIKELTFTSETAGRVTELGYKQGDDIREGQTLAHVDEAQARNGLDMANTTLRKAQSDLAKLKNLADGGGATAQQVADASFGIENAQNRIKDLELTIAKMTVKAPMSGNVVKNFIERGSFLAPGAPIAQIIDISRLKLTAKVDEADILNIRTGQTVKVKADVYPNQELTGVVRVISPLGDDAKKFPVEVEIANSSSRPLKAGMSATAFFKRGGPKQVLLIPRAVIVGSLQKAQVYTVDADNVAHLIDIRTGEVVEDKVEVVSGVTKGTKLVLSGQSNIADNTKVTIIKQ